MEEFENRKAQSFYILYLGLFLIRWVTVYGKANRFCYITWGRHPGIQPKLKGEKYLSKKHEKNIGWS